MTTYTTTPTPITYLTPASPFPSESHTDMVYTLSLSPSYLVSGSKDRTVRVWSPSARRLLFPPLTGPTISVICVHHDESEDLIFAGSGDGCVYVWRLSTGMFVRKWKAHAESVLSVRFWRGEGEGEGRCIVTGGKDRCVKVWDMEGLKLGASPSKEVAEEGGDVEVELEAVATLNEGVGAAVNCVRLTKKYIISGSGDRTLKFWKWGSWECERSLNVHGKGIATLSVSNDEKWVVTGSSDTTLKIVEIETGEVLASLDGHTSIARAVAFPPGERKDVIFSGSYDGSVVVWKKNETGEWVVGRRLKIEDVLGVPEVGDTQGYEKSLTEHNMRVFGLVCDGKRLISGNQSNTIVGWEWDE